ncbi:TIGR02391 family protein [Ponticaulis sp.]|uniref:TIGR02391 family protein n=1 Tax=Ponticaulis sp. TaxID=2020902 RepID=UPI000B70211D|nr:TIGR02391 family protein [Ponticaulis sp.]MAJ09867.1 TIGR02391 family protein [Ponticaulis sp.]RPG18481.1 MAG: TIGR02391 family protein [Hyphomonadaceae bacterium TMED125]HBH89402.1 TIGR02391 family protein [Hyphomonadaceae bacterium]|tara:strand:+ start:8196 stop:9026 length:831 start_codon:yes stop_codon:yes gene_type:complete
MTQAQENVGKTLPQAQLEAIAQALGDTDDGLTNSEIDRLIVECHMADPGPGTKWKRIYNAFAEVQNRKQNRTNVLEFIRRAMAPVKYMKAPDRFEILRTNLNGVLLFSGMAVDDRGKLVTAKTVSTISDARRRANDLRADLKDRGVHPDVLVFCKEELLADNYFHAVLEATKSIGDKLRARTGLQDDGGGLVDRALCGSPPMIAINPLQTESQKSEQKGFANLVKGTFGMFRNPTAHEARKNWNMSEDDAKDLLSLVSLIHRRIDASHMPDRTVKN